MTRSKLFGNGMCECVLYYRRNWVEIKIQTKLIDKYIGVGGPTYYFTKDATLKIAIYIKRFVKKHYDIYKRYKRTPLLIGASQIIFMVPKPLFDEFWSQELIRILDSEDSYTTKRPYKLMGPREEDEIYGVYSSAGILMWIPDEVRKNEA